MQLVNHLNQALTRAGALPARRRLRHPGRRGEDRRRVHGPDHGRPPLVGGPPPGGRGQGGRADPGGARHARDDHAPELLPPLREARRDDRYGQDGGEGVRRDLRPATSSRSRPTGRVARADQNDFIFKTKDAKFAAVVEDLAERHEKGQPVLVGTIDVETSEYLSQLMQRARHPAHRPEREGARARGRDHQGRGPAGRGHDRDEHGRPRRRHQARRGRARARRPLRARHRAARGAAHRQPAARPLGPPGRRRRDALLPLGPGPGRAPVRRRPDLQHHEPLQAAGRPADGGEDPLEPDRERPEARRGAELRDAQERPQVRRRSERPAPGDLRAAARRARGRSTSPRSSRAGSTR